MSEFTFLTEEQWWLFSDERLEIFEKRGRAAITDFSILLGAGVSDHIHIKNNDSLEGRIGYYWSKSDDGDNKLNGDTIVKVIHDSSICMGRWR